MKISIKNIVKIFLPYGIVVLREKYNTYKNIYKNKDHVFDMIISVGIACRPAYYLQKHGQRFYANPLDWMMYSLDTLIHLYKTKFTDFFIEFVEDKHKSLENNCHWFIDSKNNIASMHYEEINDTFRKIMKNRFNKINKALLNSKKICFFSSRNDDMSVFFDFLKEMGNIYPGEITLINIRDSKEIGDMNQPVKYYKEKISERFEIIEYEFNDVHPNGDDIKNNKDFWRGNYIVWDTIVKKISMKINFFTYLFKREKYY